MLADIIKIHCLTHRANFPMPRTSRAVVCRESAEAHTLSSNFPYDGRWVYCCNCQTFIAWDNNESGLSIKECPFCLSSLNPRVYACDHCVVTMVDFDDQTLRKHHAVLEWGAPQPACAGCHQFPRATPRKHFCHTLQNDVATGHAVCPFCGISTEAIGEAPSRAVTAKLDAALAEAQARTSEAEELRRLAEEAARKEAELRTQAERKAEEITQRATGQLNLAQVEQAKHQAEAARAAIETETRARAEAQRLARIAELDRQEAERRKAEAEAKVREAEIKTREIEERSRRAEAAARREAEMRAAAEQQTRDVAERFTSQLAVSQAQTAAFAKSVKKDRGTIALTTAIAVTLAGLLIMLIITLIQSLR